VFLDQRAEERDHLTVVKLYSLRQEPDAERNVDECDHPRG
jgi:hypothetical protein